MKRASTLEWNVQCNVKDVWKIVTNNGDFSWRSDIEKIDIISKTEFIEYYKGGGETKFVITEKKIDQLYEFDMSNKIFTGKWIGKFEPVSKNKTKLIFTEEIAFKNPLIYILSFVMMSLKKIQITYRDDLNAKLDSK